MTEDTFAKDISAAYAKIEELKVKISNLRKKGKDPLIPDLLLKNINAKLHYVEITRDKNDIENIQKTLKEAEEEIQTIDETNEKTLKQEIEELIQRGE